MAKKAKTETVKDVIADVTTPDVTTGPVANAEVSGCCCDDDFDFVTKCKLFKETDIDGVNEFIEDMDDVTIQTYNTTNRSYMKVRWIEIV